MTILDKITQGKWYIKEVQRDEMDYYIMRELNDVAFLNHYNGITDTEQKANAKAISKVPELLEIISILVTNFGIYEAANVNDELLRAFQKSELLWEELNKEQ